VATETAKEQSHKEIPTGSTNFIPSSLDNQDKEVEPPTNGADDEKMQAPDDEKFKERILSSLRTVQAWETVEWIKDCRSLIPWDDLRNATGPYSRPEEDRLLADDANAIFLQRFCRWFPTTMSWVNAPPCVKCGCKECGMKTVRGPETEEEKEGNAKRVEGKRQTCSRNSNRKLERPGRLTYSDVRYSILLSGMPRKHDHFSSVQQSENAPRYSKGSVRGVFEPFWVVLPRRWI
jgi:hypothetical protein